MRKTIFISIYIAFASTAIGQYNSSNLKIMDSDQESFWSTNEGDTTFIHKNLRLYPIIANKTFEEEHKDIGKFTMLKEAIEDKKIKITETGAATDESNTLNDEHVSGTVNTLIAENTSADTLFLMAGEVVKGGKQDRVIGQDVVLIPGEKKDLSAFCVEKSRWETKENNKGVFNGYFNVSSMDIRKSVTEEKNQQSVWDKVDVHTSKNNATSSTKAYTNLENSLDYQKEAKTYIEKFESIFDNEPKVIGVIAVSGDKIIGSDMFATHDIFLKSYKNLIHSYVNYAITNGAEITVGNSAVKTYLDNILKDEEKQEKKVEENGTMYKWKNKKLHITTY